jgi:hypothetical protein
MSEDAILDLLETKPSDSPSSSSLTRGSAAREGTKKTSAGRSPRKVCVKCNREMDMGVRICPHCHCYVGGAGEQRNG